VILELIGQDQTQKNELFLNNDNETEGKGNHPFSLGKCEALQWTFLNPKDMQIVS
jgi:hypothetical protein